MAQCEDCVVMGKREGLRCPAGVVVMKSSFEVIYVQDFFYPRHSCVLVYSGKRHPTHIQV